MAETRNEAIERLASTITANTAKVADYLRSEHLPFPSFDVDGPTKSLIPQDLHDIEDARHEIIDATLKLRNLMLGPRDFLQSFSGFALANNTDKSIYEVFSQHPERAKRFGSAMSACTAGIGYDLKHLMGNYPWESLGGGTVVDVGGSHGFVSARIASDFPKIRCIVQDLPEVVRDGKSKLPSELSERVTFMAHDFLTEQPVKNADVYFFRWIFHNWSDEYCIKILRNLIPALKKGARVVVNDNCLPEPGVLGLWQEEKLRSMDLTMLEIQNSCERDLDEWAVLFEKADERFTFCSGKQPEGSNLWIIEARWD